jgi:ion channel-forming bestrophin family protein
MLIDKPVPLIYVFNKIKVDVFRVFLFSIVFHTMKLFFAEDLPLIPFQLPTILGTAISLLLAFNVNQSYDRWWEARKVWGAIVNDSRSLILQVRGFIGQDGEADEKESYSAILKRMAYRQIAWCYCLGQSLRDYTPITPEQEKYLSQDELDYLQKQKNKPYGLLMLHMGDLRKLYQSGAINSFQQIQIDSTIVRLCDGMGKAERINSTVFPTTYRLFIHVFIYLFLIILSLALVETIGILEIPILVAIASTFFLIEKTARHMQDPFSGRPTDTSVTAIARTIEINIKQVLLEKDVPKPLSPQKFYIM